MGDLFRFDLGGIVDKLLLLVVLACAAFGLIRNLGSLQLLWANRKSDTTRWMKSAPNQTDDGYAREYTYKGVARIVVMLVQAAGIASVIICLLAAVALIGMVFQSTWLDLIQCLLICTLAAGWFIGVGLVNALPTVWVSEEGIAISVYFTGRVLIPWVDLIEVKRWQALPGSYIVQARRVTPMHQLYGWITGTRLPSFILLRSTDNFDLLLAQLNQGISSHSHGLGGGGGSC